jgi:hypothetical protein
LRHEIPEGSDNVIATYSVSPSGGSGPVEVTWLAKRGQEPIALRYELTAVPGEEEEEVLEVIAVRGDWEREHEAAPLAGSERVLIIRGLLPGEVLWLSPANSFGVEARVSDLRITSVPSDQLDDGTHDSDGSEPGAATGVPRGDAGDEDRPLAASGLGCPCGLGPEPLPVAPLVGWAALGLRPRRRRHG